jgi:hypothetical protein
MVHSGALKSAMTALPTWIEPGDAATLVWHSGRGEGAEGAAVYLVAGPALDTPPPSPYFLLASADRDEFAERLYRGEVDLEGLRSFLADCVLARGEMSQGLDRIAVEAETPVLDLLDAWRATAAPARLPYLDDISAFLPGDRPLFVTADAYEAACEASERFGLVSVCEECGLAEDAAAFLWTARAGKTVRVCFLIQNDGGVWTCRFHPFEFSKEAA